MLLATAPAARAAEEKQPDATIEIKEGSVGVGIGFSWGKGTLTFKGKSYPVEVDGLSVGSVGIAEATATGKVFGLAKLEDFNGAYTATNASATLGVGVGATVMRNGHNVEIQLRSETEGVKLTLAAGGVNLKLKQ